MSAITTSTRPLVSAPPSGDSDHIIVLDGATWADYERLLAMRGDRPVPRMAYLDGRIELMTPSSYATLRVPEVWIWKDGTITPQRLGRSGYRAVVESRLLPELDLAQLASFLDRKSTSRAIREYRQALRAD